LRCQLDLIESTSPALCVHNQPRRHSLRPGTLTRIGTPARMDSTILLAPQCDMKHMVD
jgi:hypothetical protein